MLQRRLSGLILTYARTYIRNVEANLNLSLWGLRAVAQVSLKPACCLSGGDVVLNNLDLRLDGE